MRKLILNHAGVQSRSISTFWYGLPRGARPTAREIAMFSKVFLVGVGCMAASLIAQAAPETHMPGMPSVDLSNLTATGLLGFYAIYVTTRVLPILQQNFRDDLAKLTQSHRDDLAKAWDKIDLLSTKVIETNTKLADSLSEVIGVLKDARK